MCILLEASEVQLIGEIMMIPRNRLPVLIISSLALLMVLLFACSSDSELENSTDAAASQSDQSVSDAEPEQAKPLGPGKFSDTGKMAYARGWHVTIKLNDGRVIAMAGKSRGGASAWEPSGIADSELYDPATGKWIEAPLMRDIREVPSGNLLNDGRVIIIGVLPLDKSLKLLSKSLILILIAGQSRLKWPHHGGAIGQSSLMMAEF